MRHNRDIFPANTMAYDNYQISLLKTSVPKRIMDMFGVSTKQLVAHMLQRGKFKQTKFSRTYRMDNNRSQFIVGIVPDQFNFLLEHYLQGQQLLKNRDMGGIQPMLLNISK